MRKLFIIPFLLFALSAEAAPPSRQSTYTTGTVISSSAVTGNEDAIFNYLQAGVDAYSDGTIVNADVHSSANIQSDKLNLTAIAQSVANSGSTTLTGTFAANGTTNSIGNGGSDTLTLNVPGGMTLSAATTWTLTGALTFSGTIADLGTVTTVDINSGTLNGMNVLGLSETTARTTVAGEGALYTKDTGGQPELFYREESNGDEIQITTGGVINYAVSKIYTSNDTFIAPTGVTKVYLSMVGGGGGAGGTGGGGGGGGGWIINYPYTVVPGNSYAIVIGAGGAGGNGTDGNNGTNTTFDSTIIALGGNKGINGGAGGAGGGGLNASGVTAGGYNGIGGNGSSPTGGGGGTPFGPGATGNVSSPGQNAGANTGGGGGGGTGGNNGGNGGSGICIVMY